LRDLLSAGPLGGPRGGLAFQRTANLEKLACARDEIGRWRGARGGQSQGEALGSGLNTFTGNKDAAPMTSLYKS